MGFWRSYRNVELGADLGSSEVGARLRTFLRHELFSATGDRCIRRSRHVSHGLIYVNHHLFYSVLVDNLYGVPVRTSMNLHCGGNGLELMRWRWWRRRQRLVEVDTILLL